MVGNLMEWMIDIQLGRRNLSPIQRIAVAEKYRPIYERQARDNLREGGRKGGLANSLKPSQNSSKTSKQNDRSENGNGGTKLTANLPQALDKKERNSTTDKKWNYGKITTSPK